MLLLSFTSYMLMTHNSSYFLFLKIISSAINNLQFTITLISSWMSSNYLPTIFQPSLKYRHPALQFLPSHHQRLEQPTRRNHQILFNKQLQKSNLRPTVRLSWYPDQPNSVVMGSIHLSPSITLKNEESYSQSL